jgi:hypothetical protein
VSLRRLKQSSSKFQMALVALIPLLCAAGARADSFDITIINATFSAECIGNTGTCTEVINGSALYDSVTNMVSDVSMSLTGTLTASLDGSGNSSALYNCPVCLLPAYIYDSGVLPSDDPIEFGPSLSLVFGFDAPTPEPLEGGANNTTLAVPSSCGGDQPLCGTTGSFPVGNDYELTSGTYTSVDVGPSAPEPGSIILLVAGVGVLGFLSRRLGVRAEFSK